MKELDLYELEEKVGKAKKTFVSISDNSTYLKNTYENVYLEDENEEDGTRRLVFLTVTRTIQQIKLYSHYMMLLQMIFGLCLVLKRMMAAMDGKV